VVNRGVTERIALDLPAIGTAHHGNWIAPSCRQENVMGARLDEGGRRILKLHRRQCREASSSKTGGSILRFRSQSPLAAVISLFLLVTYLAGQARPQGASKDVEQNGFTWMETFEGSGNTDAFITDINSTVGYSFGKHFAMDVGVPYFFIEPSTSKTGTTSASGMGNPYLGLIYSAKGSALDFSTSLNSAIPTASTAKGLSTGHVTVDWSNHFAHEFDLFTPFVDLGLANSIPDTRFLHRPYISYGDVAHFEGGSELDLGAKFSVTASGYYILPWGPQQIFLRGSKSSSGATKGGPSLTRDNGINLGFDYNLTRSLDLTGGYSYSVYSVLNTFSFGIELNAGSLLKKHSGL